MLFNECYILRIGQLEKRLGRCELCRHANVFILLLDLYRHNTDRDQKPPLTKSNNSNFHLLPSLNMSTKSGYLKMLMKSNEFCVNLCLV